MKIFIDPGHFPGNGSHVKLENDAMLVEDGLNWQIAVALDAKLSQDGHIVMLSRGEKEEVSLKERARRAGTWGADVALSLHHNISRAESVEEREQYAKTEIFVRGPNFWVPAEGHPQLNTPFNRVRVYRTDPKDERNAWMDRTRSVIYPYANQGIEDVALLECGYLNVPSHQKVINQPGYVAGMATAISNWIEARERKQVNA